MYKFKVGDEVQVRVGRDKGKKGKIEKILKNQDMLVVSGVNIYKRHRKATRSLKAGIYEITKPVLSSKMEIICPKCAKSTRIEFKFDGKTKNRVCKKCKGVI